MVEHTQLVSVIQCTGCGRELSADQAFCNYCGQAARRRHDADLEPAGDQWMDDQALGPPIRARWQLVDGQRLALAGTSGLLAALVLGYGWYRLALIAEQEFTLVAFVIGLLVGLVVAILGEGSLAVPYRLLGAILAATSVAVGQYLLYARPQSPFIIHFDFELLLIYLVAFFEGWQAPRIVAERDRLRFKWLDDHNQGIFLLGSVFLLLLVLIFGFFTGIMVGPDAVQAKIHGDRAFGMMNDGRSEQAMAEYQLAIEHENDYAYAHYFLGILQWNDGELLLARDSLVKALALGLENESISMAKTYLGLIDWNLSDEQSALVYLNEAIDGGAATAGAYLIRGAILGERGESQSAAADLNRALSMGLVAEDETWAQDMLDQLEGAD